MMESSNKYKQNTKSECDLLKTGLIDNSFVPNFENDSGKNGLGIAIDIGTTTLSLSIIDFETGKIIATEDGLNPQKIYGTDVLSRITYEFENPSKGAENLKRLLVSALNRLIDRALAASEKERKNIRGITVSANCVMAHTLLGVDARSMGRYPFKPEFVKSQKINASDIGLNVSEDVKLYILPNVSAFFGGDAVAGVYISEIYKDCCMDHKVLFIDIGTNGEIVLESDGGIISCSCIAGSVLEGINISSGMSAKEGAIEDVRILEDGSIELDVIGNVKPRGICGNGLLAAVRELIANDMIRPRGGVTAFVNGNRVAFKDKNTPANRLFLDSDGKIYISQSDIRKLQTAKASISLGIEFILEKANITADELDDVLIAGQFGKKLPIDSLIKVGIIPESFRDKVKYLGNTAKMGAYAALVSEKARRDMEKLADSIEYFEIDRNKEYMNEFKKRFMFIQG